MPKNPHAVNLGRLGGKARAARMSSEERSEASRKAVAARWAAMTPAQRSAAAKKSARKRKK